mmetsp:Transcript_34279/g.97154  ORF Transcript_34279/g.97154 Transcript_34279/m.97154 type:complete len:218 (-) Transcript_34279:853-1506(-)
MAATRGRRTARASAGATATGLRKRKSALKPVVHRAAATTRVPTSSSTRTTRASTGRILSWQAITTSSSRAATKCACRHAGGTRGRCSATSTAPTAAGSTAWTSTASTTRRTALSAATRTSRGTSPHAPSAQDCSLELVAASLGATLTPGSPARITRPSCAWTWTSMKRSEATATTIAAPAPMMPAAPSATTVTVPTTTAALGPNPWGASTWSPTASM